MEVKATENMGTGTDNKDQVRIQNCHGQCASHFPMLGKAFKMPVSCCVLGVHQADNWEEHSKELYPRNWFLGASFIQTWFRWQVFDFEPEPEAIIGWNFWVLEAQEYILHMERCELLGPDSRPQQIVFS